jgi:putative FmdB family regulatory protein
MPVYTYQCESCGVRFDRYQKFTDQSLTWCPECGKKALRKVYSPVGIVFKGPGFYSTDNKSASGVSYANKNSEKSEEAAKAASEKKTPEASSTSTEAKPAKPAATEPKE